jgi:DNA-binding response OmpR family regulator
MKTRLLVHVDDDEDWGFLLERALLKGELQGWNYHFLNGGHSALDYLMKVTLGETEPPDLLALDLRMPCLDGLHILGWTTIHLPSIPVVMLSSSELLTDRLAARDRGSKGYFSKDMAFSDFVEFLRACDETAFAFKENSTRALGTSPDLMVAGAHLTP